jgi:creatinine amidohydrolase
MTYPYARLDSFRDIPAYDDLTSPDIAAAVAAGAHVIVPCCATEAHGAHLPLGTDTIQGIDMCRRAVHRLQQEGIPLVLGPAIPFGPKAILTESPREFPGTINIAHDTLKCLVRDVCQQLVGQGFRVVYLLCGHAESDPVLQIVAKEISEMTEASVVTLQWLVGIQPGYKGVMRSEKPQGHAGEGETARMLVTAPHLVRMDEARSYHPAIPPDPAPNDKMPYLGGAIGRYKYPPAVFENFDDGIWGDPQNATEAVGEKSYALITDWLCAAIRSEWRIWNPTT